MRRNQPIQGGDRPGRLFSSLLAAHCDSPSSPLPILHLLLKPCPSAGMYPAAASWKSSRCTASPAAKRAARAQGWHEADICDITMLVSDRLHRIANNHRERTVLRVWSVLLGVRRGGVQPAAPTGVTRTCCTRVSRRTLQRSEMHPYLSVRYLYTYSRGTFVSLSEVPV